MADRKSAKYPYRWSNGTWHSRPERESDLPGIQFPGQSSNPAIDPASVLGALGQISTAVTAAKGSSTPIPVGGVTGSAPPQLPLDPAQEAARVANQRYLGISEADAAYQTGRIENEYGLGLDKSNPFSRARLMEEEFKRAQRGTTNSLAAQGQLYSGYHQRMQGENTRNYNIGFDRLARDYGDQLRGVQLGRLQSYASYGTANDEEAYRALLRQYRGG